MKTYAVVSAHVTAPSVHRFHAEEFSNINNETVIMKDEQGSVVAVISLKNAVAIYEDNLKQ